jgi:hypothetical protein
MNSSRAQIYEMHPMSRSIYWFMCALALVGGVAALVASFRVTDGQWFIGILGALFIVCGLSMFIRLETIVESDARIVRRQLRLFGRFLVSSRQYSFSDFSSVAVRRVRRSNFGRDPDQFFVSLRPRSGRQVLIRYFEADIARNCRPAEELAQRLSTDLQIEIDDHDAS